MPSPNICVTHFFFCVVRRAQIRLAGVRSFNLSSNSNTGNIIQQCQVTRNTVIAAHYLAIFTRWWGTGLPTPGGYVKSRRGTSYSNEPRGGRPILYLVPGMCYQLRLLPSFGTTAVHQASSPRGRERWYKRSHSTNATTAAV